MSETNIVPIRDNLSVVDPRTVNKTALKYVKWLLERVKDGEINHVAMDYVYHDGSSGCFFTQSNDALVARAHILAHKLTSNNC